ncbi:MAG: JAB domain-containing protein [Myxococcota bacterium]
MCRSVGVGPVRAARLLAGLELGRRVRQRRATLARADHPGAVVELFDTELLDTERFWLVTLDGQGRVRSKRCLAHGGQQAVNISAREILSMALRDGAQGFVLVHNHPGGSTVPSPEDVEMTHAVERAADLVGVPLLDHIVIGAGGRFTSLYESGRLVSSSLPRAG